MTKPAGPAGTGREPLARQLLLIRNFYDDAARCCAGGGPFLAMKAALQLDLCVELMLNAVIYDAPIDSLDRKGPKDREPNFDRLWQLATQAYKARTNAARLPNQDALKRLRDVRNLGQHNGTTPSDIEVQRYLPRAEEFLRTVYCKFFEVGFDGFVLCDLLPSAELRRFMKEIEALFDEGNYLAVLISCAIIHDKVLWKLLPGATPRDLFREIARELKAPMGRRNGRSHGSELERSFEKVIGRVAGVEEEVTVLALGIRPADRRRFKEVRSVIGGPHEMLGGDWGCSILGGVSEDAAVFALRYVARFLYAAAEAFPEAIHSLQFLGFPSTQKWGA